MITDTVSFTNEAIQKGKNILIEGANATMIDLDFGTYPYVTSSNASVGSTCTGLGLPPQAVRNITGIVKAYCTRVGEGPFPTELLDDVGVFLRTKVMPHIHICAPWYAHMYTHRYKRACTHTRAHIHTCLCDFKSNHDSNIREESLAPPLAVPVGVAGLTFLSFATQPCSMASPRLI